MSLKPRTGAAFGGYFGVSDLNDELPMRQSSDFAFAGDADEPRQDVVRPTHGLSAMEDFSSHRRSPRRRSLRQVDDVRRAIPRDGFRSIDLPREPAGHRGLSPGPPSHGTEKRTIHVLQNRTILFALDSLPVSH